MKVFDNTGKYLSRIGNTKGDEKMYSPHSLVIYENRILISQGYYSFISTSCILNYQLDGKFISRIGREGTADLEFRDPFGLTINQTNGDIYVCDRDNKRIQIISKDFRFISKFGEDSLSEPRDIKLSKDYIYVLDASNPCVYLFDYDHIYRRNISLEGKECLFLIHISFSLMILIISSFQTEDLILFLYSILFLNSFTRFLYQIIQWEL